MSKKLRFQPAHSPGTCGASFLPNGSWYLTSGSDGVVFAHEGNHGSRGSSMPRRLGKVFDDNLDSILTIAVSPSGWGFITGDDEGRVRLFKIPQESEIDWVSENSGVSLMPAMVRFGGPVRTAAFSRSGNSFVAAGEEPGVIKMMNTADIRNHTILRGQGGVAQEDCINDLSYDPQGDYILSVGERGALCVWAIDSLEFERAIDLQSVLVNSVCWSSDGKKIAAGTQDGIKIIDRETWSVEKTVGNEGGHRRGSKIQSVQWSSSGEYIISGDSDGFCLLLETKKYVVLSRWKGDNGIQHVRWNPTRNTIALVDELGQTAVCSDIVEENLPDSFVTKSLPATTPIASGKAEDASSADVAKHLDDEAEDEQVRSRRRLRRVDSDESQGVAGSTQQGEDSMSPASLSEEETLEAERNSYQPEKRARSRKSRQPLPQIVESFMPASTPTSERTKKSILCWNRMGTLLVFKEENYQSIEVDFHDRSRRPFRFIDHLDIRVGAMDGHGALFGCRSTDEHPPMIVYKPFESWTQNADWSVRLPQDEVVLVVALGGHFTAAGLSNNHIRVFNMSAVEVDVCSAGGRIVTMCAANDRLAVVTCSEFSGELSLAIYQILSDGHMLRTHSENIATSPRAAIAWIGFSTSESDLVIMDSAGVFHLLEESENYCKWIVLGTSAESDSGKFWPVSVSSNTAIGVNLYGDERYPAIVPRPPVTKISFPPVTAHATKVQWNLFEKSRSLRFMRSALRRNQKTEAFFRDVDVDMDLLDRYEQQKNDVEKLILRAIEEACKMKNAGRALELTTTLQETWSLKLALKLASHYKLDSLLERMKLSIQARIQAGQQDEEGEGILLPQTSSASAPDQKKNVSQVSAMRAQAEELAECLAEEKEEEETEEKSKKPEPKTPEPKAVRKNGISMAERFKRKVAQSQSRNAKQSRTLESPG